MIPADQLAALERMGVPADKARAAVALNMPVERVEQTSQAAETGVLRSHYRRAPEKAAEWQEIAGLAARPISEKEEQRRIRRTAIEHGAKVYWLSQKRKTQQTAGIPDLWLAFQSFGMWWETKTAEEAASKDGGLSPFQQDFRDECLRNGTPWGSGTHAEFCAWLERAVAP